MFAVIRTGGKQYRVVPDEVLEVARLAGEPGQIIQIPEVLIVGGDTPVVGNPAVAGASVAAEVVEHGRGPKVIAFKKRRRKNSRRKRGHRQEYTLIRITEILTDGQQPSLTAKPRAARAKPAAEAAPQAAPAAEAPATETPPAAEARKPAKRRAKPAAEAGESKE